VSESIAPLPLPSVPAGTRRADSRREEILDAAVELFATRGYRGTGLLALAERVGMSHVGILRHFGTKEGLLLAVMQRREVEFARSSQEVDQRDLRSLLAVSMPREPDILTKLTVVLRAENLEPDAPLHEFFVAHHRRAYEFLAAMIARGQDAGELRSDVDPKMKALEIIAFAWGLEAQYVLVPDVVNPQNMQKMQESYLRLAFEDLSRPDAPRNKRSNAKKRPTSATTAGSKKSRGATASRSAKK
jgi:AcrR family transcriptional regulator